MRTTTTTTTTTTTMDNIWHVEEGQQQSLMQFLNRATKIDFFKSNCWT